MSKYARLLTAIAGEHTNPQFQGLVPTKELVFAGALKVQNALLTWLLDTDIPQNAPDYLEMSRDLVDHAKGLVIEADDIGGEMMRQRLLTLTLYYATEVRMKQVEAF